MARSFQNQKLIYSGSLQENNMLQNIKGLECQ